MMRKLFLTIGILILVSYFSVSLFADYKITATSTTKIGDQPATTKETITYISEHGVYTKMSNKTGILYNTEFDQIYFILSENKQCMEADWKKINAARTGAEAFMKDATITLKDTGKTEKVDKWQAKIWVLKVKATLFQFSIKFYMYDGLKLPASYGESMDKMARLNPFNVDTVIDKMKALNGYIVKMIVDVDSPQGKVETTMQVKKIEEKELKKSGFELFKKYNKIDFDAVKIQKMFQ